MYLTSQLLFAAVLLIPPYKTLQTIKILEHTENES